MEFFYTLTNLLLNKYCPSGSKYINRPLIIEEVVYLLEPLYDKTSALNYVLESNRVNSMEIIIGLKGFRLYHTLHQISDLVKLKTKHLVPVCLDLQLVRTIHESFKGHYLFELSNVLEKYLIYDIIDIINSHLLFFGK